MTVPTNGTTIDVTLRIGLPQNEIGSFVSPPIKTGSGTRASDNPNLTNQALAVAQKAKSAFFMSNGVTYSNSNRWLQYPTTNGTALQIFMTSQTGMQVNNSIVAASAINQNWSNLSKISASYDSNVICAKANNATPQRLASTFVANTHPVYIGCSNSSGNYSLNGFMKRIAFSTKVTSLFDTFTTQSISAIVPTPYAYYDFTKTEDQFVENTGPTLASTIGNSIGLKLIS